MVSAVTLNWWRHDFSAHSYRARIWEWDTLPYRAAAKHLIDEVIDPADTRAVIARFLELSRTKRAVGRHRLASWPTKF